MTTQEYINNALINGLWVVRYSSSIVVDNCINTEEFANQFYSIEDALHFKYALENGEFEGILYHGIVLHTK